MTIEFITSQTPIPYPEALAWMEQRVEAITAGTTPDCIWCLEHPPLYTAGSSAKPEHLLNHEFPTYSPGRGGQWTYHGPGQVVAYVMMDLKKLYAPHAADLRDFIRRLECWIIATLLTHGVEGSTIEGRTGVWVGNAKIAAIGVRVRHGVSYHGISINVHPDLSHYAGIIPCGIDDAGVTSLQACGKDTLPDAVIASLQAHMDVLYARSK